MAKKILERIKANGSSMLDLLFPIGTIHMSTSSANPSTYYGGTWVLWGAGKVPVCVNTSEIEFSTVEKTGGSKTHAHTTGDCTLTISQIPSHAHEDFSRGTPNWGLQSGSTGWSDYIMMYGKTTASNQANTSSVGGGKAHNHGNTGNGSSLQPYITCYMWKRTS